jgi:hypothetical protein
MTQDELLNHKTLLNHQSKAIDTSTYALFTHKPNTGQFHPKNRGSSFSKFPPRNFGSRTDATAQAPTPRYNAVPPPARYSEPSRHPASSRYHVHRMQPAPDYRFLHLPTLGYLAKSATN